MLGALSIQTVTITVKAVNDDPELVAAMAESLEEMEDEDAKLAAAMAASFKEELERIDLTEKEDAQLAVALTSSLAELVAAATGAGPSSDGSSSLEAPRVRQSRVSKVTSYARAVNG